MKGIVAGNLKEAEACAKKLGLEDWFYVANLRSIGHAKRYILTGSYESHKEWEAIYARLFALNKELEVVH